MTWRHSSRESTLAPKSLRCPWLVTKFSEDTIFTAGLIIVPKNVQNCNYDVVKRVLYNITIKTFELTTVQCNSFSIPSIHSYYAILPLQEERSLNFNMIDVLTYLKIRTSFLLVSRQSREFQAVESATGSPPVIHQSIKATISYVNWNTYYVPLHIQLWTGNST